MKLYYAPGACSLAPHIVLREAGLDFEPVKTDIRAKTLPDGSDYLAINPKGAVPALGLDGGEVLTENAVVMQYIADQAPASGLIPASGTARYRVLEWLSYIGSEVHKSYGALWNPASSDEAKQAARELVGKKFDFVAGRLGDKPYLTGDNFSPADAYFFVMLSWTRMHGIGLSRWPTLIAFQDRVAARPAAQAAMRAEGLIQ
ncbi:MAG TPA: glutathione transferase GstA [Sphingomonadaceae bacterium]|nr:glutathione transferase GstA [Sphingomonadaceae bacterium]